MAGGKNQHVRDLGRKYNFFLMHLTVWLTLIAAIYLVESGRLQPILIAVVKCGHSGCFEVVIPLGGMPAYWQQSLAEVAAGGGLMSGLSVDSRSDGNASKTANKQF